MTKKNEKAEKAPKTRKPKKGKSRGGSKERFDFIVQQLEDLSKAVRNLNAELGNLKAEIRKSNADREFPPVAAKKIRRGS
jgi:chromosome segregation ATPase